MLKRTLTAILTALLLYACGTEKQNAEATFISLAEIDTKAAEFVEKQVSLEGTVVHVCRHGGKKMFIVGDDPEKRFKITAGAEIGAFNVELEGSDVRVVGLLEELRVDETYLNNRESEINTKHQNEAGHKEENEEVAEEHFETELRQIKSLRKKLADSGEDHLSFYSLKCNSFTEIQPQL